MKKAQLLTVMALMTVLGIGITAVGFFSLVQQDPSFSYSQAWAKLWELHAAFGWTMAIYCAFMLLLDLWMAAGMLRKNPDLNAAETHTIGE